MRFPKQTISRYDLLLQRVERRMQLWRGQIARWQGVQAGQRFGLGRGVQIIYPSYLEVGSDVTILDLGYLHCLSSRGVHIGSNTSIERNLWLHCGGSADLSTGSFFEIGERSFIGPNAVIGPSGGVVIGNDVLIGPNLTITSENHRFDDIGLRIAEQGVKRDRVKISDNCWIASNVTILAGVTVGEGCVIAAGAVVTKDIPPNSVVGGVPARLLRMRGQTNGRDSKIP